jgi:hypothetical protein
VQFALTVGVIADNIIHIGTRLAARGNSQISGQSM